MRKLLKFIPIQLTLFLILGILFGSYFSIAKNTIVVINILLLIFLAVSYYYSNKKYTNSYLFLSLVFLLTFFIGFTSIILKNQLNHQKHYANNSNFSAEKPLNTVISIQEILKSTQFYNKYEGKVIQLEKNSTVGKILINIKKDSISNNLLKVDDKIYIEKAFLVVPKPLNPFSFNYKSYLKKQQIHHQVIIDEKSYLKVDSSQTTIRGLAAKFRDKINLVLMKNGFENEELAVINALLLGQRQNITNQLMESYSGAGAIHILAVSGLHVGIILLLLSFLFKPLHLIKNGKLIASILTITFLWLYAIIAGLSPSVVRAVTMFTAVAIGMYLNKPSNIYNTLFISMFFLVLVNPYYVFEVGFQLSYLAVFSIVWIQPKIYKLWNTKYWVVDKLWQLFTVSIAAQIGVLPLSLYYFHQFPGLFFLSNLVIIPFLGFILVAGIAIIAFALLNILPSFLALYYNVIIQQLNTFVKWVANQKVFIIENIPFSFLVMVPIYLSIVMFFKWTEKKTFTRIALFLLSIIFANSMLIFEKYKRQSTNEFIVFNTTRKNLIAKRNGDKVTFYTSEKEYEKNNYITSSYLVGSGIRNKIDLKSPKNLYTFNNELILVIDSLGMYNYNSVKPSILLLSQSPKINMDRLLKALQPKLIIADASNYKSYVERWEQTCLKNKTPFYNTRQKGAFILNNE